MRRALLVLCAIGGVAHAKPAAKAKPADTTATFVGGHLTMTVPAGWAVIPPGGAAEGMGKGTTLIQIFVLPGSPDAMMDTAESAEADTITYTDRGFGMVGGLHVIAAPGKAKSGTGGRELYAAATCLGTILIADQWDGAAPDKGLDQALHSIAYLPDGGTMYVQKGDADKLAPAAHDVAERAARAACLGATSMFTLDVGDPVDVDGTTMDRKAIADAANKAGDLATWLRMTSGMWQVEVDPDDANHFAVTRVPTKAIGEAAAETALLYELHAGAWKLVKIKRAAP